MAQAGLDSPDHFYLPVLAFFFFFLSYPHPQNRDAPTRMAQRTVQVGECQSHLPDLIITPFLRFLLAEFPVI